MAWVDRHQMIRDVLIRGGRPAPVHKEKLMIGPGSLDHICVEDGWHIRIPHASQQAKLRVNQGDVKKSVIWESV
jgi:hypothetical protein